MEILSGAELSVALLAGVVGLYQVWLFSRSRKRVEGLYAGVMSGFTALYAACGVVTYESEDPATVGWATKLSFVAVAGLVHSVPAFAGAVSDRPLPRWSRIGPLSFALWSLLVMATDLVVSRAEAPMHLSLLSRPCLQPVATAWTGIFLVYSAAVAALGVGWLVRATRGGWRPDRLLVAGLVVWVAAGCADTAFTLRLAGSPPLFFMEYGFLGFALALFARAAREHADALAAREVACQATERSFRQLIEASPELVTVQRRGRFVYANPTAARALGYGGPEDLVGAPGLDVVHPADRERVARRLRSIELGGGPAPLAEERWVRKDGDDLRVEVLALPVAFEEATSVLVVARDLSDKARLEARMLQLDRVVSAGMMAAGVAHEINNPLTFVLGNVSAASRDLDELEARLRRCGSMPELDGQPRPLLELASSLRGALEDIDAGGTRIRDIVRDLLSLARARDREKHPTSVQAVVDEAVKLAHHEIKHRARLSRDISPTPRVMADEAQLVQVVLNLLVNAAQAIPMGHASEHEVRVSTGLRGGRVVLEVRDTGAGIPEDLLPHVFEPFVTTKPAGQGTGLGLAICRGIVLDHDGDLEVESAVGEGSTFRVILDPCEGEAEPRAARRSSPAPPTGRGRVLVVDDEPLVLRAVLRSLRADHDVVGATDGSAALEEVAEGPFDLILCDLMMPEMTGIDFVVEVERRSPEQAARTVLMTGGLLEADARAFVEARGLTTLDKPLDAALLRRTVQEHVRRGVDGADGGSPESARRRPSATPKPPSP